MSDRVVHCPFLNRADTRCSRHFSLDDLEHAFDHCFDRYKTCPTYLELLVERRVRRAGDSILRTSSPSEPCHASSSNDVVQLRIPAGRSRAYQDAA